MAMNDPKTIAKLLRAIAGGSNAKADRSDVIFNVAADMLDPPPSDVIALFYVKDRTIFQRPTRTSKGNTMMGFAVCDVRDGLNPNEVCNIMNRGEPAKEA